MSKSFMAESDWLLNPGDRILRRDLHRQYGGRTQGGIGPSTRTANVLIFSEPLVGKKYGYNFDGRMADGCYHYTGEGQHGDQEMKSGNAAILRHKRDGRALRLFKGVRGKLSISESSKQTKNCPSTIRTLQKLMMARSAQ
jgi:hypothetical protein